jgi:hypothetical protein
MYRETLHEGEADMQKAARSELIPQAPDEVLGIAALCRANCVRVPLRPIHVVDGDKGRLAAHRKAHIASLQAPVHLMGRLRAGVPSLLTRRIRRGSRPTRIQAG